MNNALDIAKYVVNYSIDINDPISHLKLQKILFYIQAALLVEVGEPAFYESIINWTYGPVVPEVYNEFKKYGYCTIEDKILSSTELYINPNTLDVSFENKEFNDEIIDTTTKSIIQKTVNAYKSVTAIKMMKKTHTEDPWKNTSNGEQIQLENIRAFYSINKNILYNE